MMLDDGPSAYSMMRQATAARLPVSEQTRTRARRRFAVLGPLHGLAWAAAAYVAVPGYFDTFRVMATNAVDHWGDDEAMMGASMGMMMGAIMLGSFLGFAALTAAMKAYGTFRLGSSAAHSFSMSGIALGLVAAVYTDSWTAPDHVGSAISSTFGTEEPWAAWAWVMYYLPFGLPALFLLIAVICGIRFLVGRRKADQGESTAQRLRVSGQHVEGHVIAAEFTNTWILGQPQFDLVVTFMTHLGPRQVRQQVITSPIQAPQNGALADVWYDPADPSTALVELRPTNDAVDPRLFMPRD